MELRREKVYLENWVPENRRSKRFSPSAITEKLIPVLLAILVLALLAVLVIVGLSLLGVTPSA